MKRALATLCLASGMLGEANSQAAETPPAGAAIPVTVDNFIRAESDLYVRSLARQGGTKEEVDPVRRLLGAAARGGNPDKDATYLNVTPGYNDGKTVYKLSVTDVPVDGFWSVSVYDAKGYYEPNKYRAYTLNDVTAKKGRDGSITIQFGACDGKVANCLPVTSGWNYMVRLYRPRAEVLNGDWHFPQAQPEAGS